MEKAALYKITYGLYIVTSVRGEEKNGFVCNTAFQITSKPPQVAIGVSTDNYTHEFIRESGLFGISVIGREVDRKMIQVFGYASGRDRDKFAEVAWEAGSTGVPLLKDGILATMECRVKASVSLSTHTIFIGEVVDGKVLSDAEPMTYEYYRSTMKGRAPKNAPTYSGEDKEPAPAPSAAPADSGKRVCSVCGYEYDPAVGDPGSGIPPGTPFEELPEDWTCPVCGASKDEFA